MSADEVRVLVADDDTLVRSGLVALLQSDRAVRVVAEAATGREAVELSRRHAVDVALLDVRMPDLDGIAAAGDILRRDDPPRVVILTTFNERAYLARALQIGVDGFLLKSGDPAELIRAVRGVSRGGLHLTPDVARMLVSVASLRDVEIHDLSALTDRERDVLSLVSKGDSNADIASTLHISEGTVKGHVSSIMARLGVTNRVQAAIIGHDAGL